jgi:hypothetical protein
VTFLRRAEESKRLLFGDSISVAAFGRNEGHG